MTQQSSNKGEQQGWTASPAVMPDTSYSTSNCLLRSLHESRLERHGKPDDPSATAFPAASTSEEASHSDAYLVKPLLVLDLDGTLVDTTRSGARAGAPSFQFTKGPTDTYDTRLRPGLKEFLSTVQPHVDLAIWTAAPIEYADVMIAGIEQLLMPGFRASLCCIYSRANTTMSVSSDRSRMRVTKDLRSLAHALGRPLCRCLIVDDTPETYRLNPSNALPVPGYQGAHVDDALARLSSFLLGMIRPGSPLDVSAYHELLPPSMRSEGVWPLLQDSTRHESQLLATGDID